MTDKACPGSPRQAFFVLLPLRIDDGFVNRAVDSRDVVEAVDDVQKLGSITSFIPSQFAQRFPADGNRPFCLEIDNAPRAVLI